MTTHDFGPDDPRQFNPIYPFETGIYHYKENAVRYIVDKPEREIKVELMRSISGTPGKIAKWHIERYLDSNHYKLYKLIDSMELEGSINVVEKANTKKSSGTHKLLYPEPMWYDGAKQTYRSLASHPDNIHGISAMGIQKRMASGLTASQSLSLPKAERTKRR